MVPGLEGSFSLRVFPFHDLSVVFLRALYSPTPYSTQKYDTITSLRFLAALAPITPPLLLLPDTFPSLPSYHAHVQTLTAPAPLFLLLIPFLKPPLLPPPRRIPLIHCHTHLRLIALFLF